MTPHCDEHYKVVEGLARIEQKQDNALDHIDRLDKRVNGAFSRIDKHVDEGDKEGGFRDRLIKLETIIVKLSEEKLNSVKAAQYRIALIVGAPAMILVILKIVDFFKVVK